MANNTIDPDLFTYVDGTEGLKEKRFSYFDPTSVRITFSYGNGGVDLTSWLPDSDDAKIYRIPDGLTPQQVAHVKKLGIEIIEQSPEHAGKFSRAMRYLQSRLS